MIVLADISYGLAAGRELPPIALTGGSNVAPGVRPDPVPPVGARDGGKAISDEASGARGEPANPKDRRPASTSETNSDASGGCGWRLVYERELKQVFFDLVERDSDEVVMRIPHESLVRYLRSVADVDCPAFGGRGGGAIGFARLMP